MYIYISKSKRGYRSFNAGGMKQKNFSLVENFFYTPG